MKIALMLTGFLRTYEKSYKFLENNLFNKYNIDIYLSTWNRQENGSFIAKDFYNLYSKHNLKKVIIEDIDSYNKNKFIIKKITRLNDVFDINERAKEHGFYWANRLKDQWYLVKKAFLSIEKTENYDIIMRFRFDIFLEYINLYLYNGITIPKDIGGWSFSDHMAYGDAESMKKYSFLHDHIYDLYLKNNIDITHAVDMPQYYLTNYNKPININIDHSIKYYIRK